MSKYLPAINTALLAFCAVALAALWWHETRDFGVQCLDPNHPEMARLRPGLPGYCIAIAPARLDRDGVYARD